METSDSADSLSETGSLSEPSAATIRRGSHEMGASPRKAASAGSATVGRWIRHHRRAAGLTLEELSEEVGKAPSHLSLIETGKRDARPSLLLQIAGALGVLVDDLMKQEAPDRRAELEMTLQRLQRSADYKALGLPEVRTTKSLSTEALESLVGLHDELARRSSVHVMTPDDVRRANSALRARMKESMNYLGDIEAQAEHVLEAVHHRGGPVGERRIIQIADHLGFTLRYVSDLPHSTRSVTDLKNRRIYLLQHSSDDPDHRTTVLKTLGHHVLGHQPPRDYAEFLRQRVEVNYFASAVLVAQSQAVELMQRGKQGRYLAIQDIRDAFSVSYETAAHRFTNLATKHLGFGVHFVKVHENGTIYKAYENNGLPFPTDPYGAVEGQLACRWWPARYALDHAELGTTHWQYVETPQGTFWSSAQTSTTPNGRFSVSVGVTQAEAKWFRGRDTTLRTTSTCPNDTCCRRPPKQLVDQWHGHAWASARAHAHLVAALPPETFPGVDTTEVYSFLEQHTALD